jgi:hypothetical protein
MSSELGLNSDPELTPPKRKMSVNFTNELDREKEPVSPPVTNKNGSPFLTGKGVDPKRDDIAITPQVEVTTFHL